MLKAGATDSVHGPDGQYRFAGCTRRSWAPFAVCDSVCHLIQPVQNLDPTSLFKNADAVCATVM